MSRDPRFVSRPLDTLDVHPYKSFSLLLDMELINKGAMRNFSILLMVITISLASGCAYTNIQMPLDKNFNQTEISSKTGTADTHTVLYLVSWGDAGTKAAADQGGLKQINYADRQIFSVLFGL